MKNNSLSLPTKKLNKAIILKALQKQAAPLIKELQGLKAIKTKEDFEQAGRALKQLKELGKEAEQQENKFVEPLKGVIKDLKAFFEPFRNDVSLVEKTVKENMLVFLNANEEKIKLLDAKLDEGKIGVQSYTIKGKELVATNEFVQQRTKQVVVVTNIKKIPHKFLLPNLPAIKEALLKGKAVAGAKLETEKVLAV